MSDRGRQPHVSPAFRSSEWRSVGLVRRRVMTIRVSSSSKHHVPRSTTSHGSSTRLCQTLAAQGISCVDIAPGCRTPASIAGSSSAPSASAAEMRLLGSKRRQRRRSLHSRRSSPRRKRSSGRSDRLSLCGALESTRVSPVWRVRASVSVSVDGWAWGEG